MWVSCPHTVPGSAAPGIPGAAPACFAPCPDQLRAVSGTAPPSAGPGRRAVPSGGFGRDLSRSDPVERRLPPQLRS